jgi:hypothetical protein
MSEAPKDVQGAPYRRPLQELEWQSPGTYANSEGKNLKARDKVLESALFSIAVRSVTLY